jgi:hypothetical protein
VPDQANSIAPVGRALRREGARDEEKDLRGKRPPLPGDPEPFRPQAAARARRGIAPEIRQDALDEVDPLRRRGQIGEGLLCGLVRPRNADPALGKADARPGEEKRGRADAGRFPPETPNEEN